jgi:hypothetical protein
MHNLFDSLSALEERQDGDAALQLAQCRRRRCAAALRKSSSASG